MTDDSLAALDKELDRQARRWRCKLVRGFRMWELEPPASSALFTDFHPTPVADLEVALDTARMLATAEAMDAIMEICPRCSCDEVNIYPATAQRVLIIQCRSCELVQHLSFKFIKKFRDDE